MTTEKRKGVTEEVEAELVGDVEAGTVDSTALAVVTKAEIDVQIATAKAYPRSIQKFIDEAKTMATLSQETAGKMYYRLKRRSKEGTKTIEGPSIRLAEVAMAAWGNTLVMSRPIAVEETVVRCQGLAWDLEKNNRRVFEVTRRITNADGRRYSEDMIVVTQQAASQIAARNAIFGVVPRVYVDNLVKACKAVFLGDAKGIEEKRKVAIAEFAKIGAKVEDVLKLVGKRGVNDLDIEDLIDLRGLLTAIEEGHTTLKEALAAEGAAEVVVTPGGLTAEALANADSVEGKDDGKPTTEEVAAQKPEPKVAKAEPVKAEKPAPVKPPKDDAPPEDEDVASLFE